MAPLQGTFSPRIVLDHVPDAIAATGGHTPAARKALSYFSLTTITTAGFGDVVPVHPFVRSQANLEAVPGQLFSATLVARLVALHVPDGKR